MFTETSNKQPTRQPNKQAEFLISSCCFSTLFRSAWKHNQSVRGGEISLSFYQLTFPLLTLKHTQQPHMREPVQIWRETYSSVFWDVDANQIHIDPAPWRLHWAARAVIDKAAPRSALVPRVCVTLRAHWFIPTETSSFLVGLITLRGVQQQQGGQSQPEIKQDKVQPLEPDFEVWVIEVGLTMSRHRQSLP